MNWRNAHLAIGAIGLLLFVLQGQYMARVLFVSELSDAARMLYRSAHIYLLLVCSANVCIGYFMPADRPAQLLQRLASCIFLVAPVVFIFSFLTESTAGDLERPVMRLSLFALFGASALLVLGEAYRRFQQR